MSVLSYLQTVLRPCQPLCTVLSSLRISPETIVAIAVMDNFVLSFLWLLPLPSEETYAPGKSIKSCDSGDIFFHWFLWEWNEALQWEGYFAFCILFVCWRVYTSTLSLITSLSCQLVAMSVAEGSEAWQSLSDLVIFHIRCLVLGCYINYNLWQCLVDFWNTKMHIL